MADEGLTPEELEERVREKAALKEAKAKLAAEKIAAKEAKKKLRCEPAPSRLPMLCMQRPGKAACMLCSVRNGQMIGCILNFLSFSCADDRKH